MKRSREEEPEDEHPPKRRKIQPPLIQQNDACDDESDTDAYYELNVQHQPQRREERCRNCHQIQQHRRPPQYIHREPIYERPDVEHQPVRPHIQDRSVHKKRFEFKCNICQKFAPQAQLTYSPCRCEDVYRKYFHRHCFNRKYRKKIGWMSLTKYADLVLSIVFKWKSNMPAIQCQKCKTPYQVYKTRDFDPKSSITSLFILSVLVYSVILYFISIKVLMWNYRVTIICILIHVAFNLFKSLARRVQKLSWIINMFYLTWILYILLNKEFYLDPVLDKIIHFVSRKSSTEVKSFIESSMHLYELFNEALKFVTSSFILSSFYFKFAWDYFMTFGNQYKIITSVFIGLFVLLIYWWQRATVNILIQIVKGIVNLIVLLYYIVMFLPWYLCIRFFCMFEVARWNLHLTKMYEIS